MIDNNTRHQRKMYELAMANIARPIECCKDKKKWRWFVLVDGTWKEGNKGNIQRLVWDALPERYKSPTNVVLVIGWHKGTNFLRNADQLINNGLLNEDS